MHEYYLNTLKIPEEKIPAVYRKVAAEMIRCNTSLAVRRRLAGEHQAKQHDAHGATSSDNVAAFMRACRDKRAKLNEPFLTDNEVWMVIKTIGLDRDKSFEELKKKKPNESEHVLRDRVVCHLNINEEVRVPFLSEGQSHRKLAVTRNVLLQLH